MSQAIDACVFVTGKESYLLSTSALKMARLSMTIACGDAPLMVKAGDNIQMGRSVVEVVWVKSEDDK